MAPAAAGAAVFPASDGAAVLRRGVSREARVIDYGEAFWALVAQMEAERREGRVVYVPGDGRPAADAPVVPVWRDPRPGAPRRG